MTKYICEISASIWFYYKENLLLAFNVWSSVSSVNLTLFYISIYFCNLYYDHTFISNFTLFLLFSPEVNCAFGGLDFPRQGSHVKVWLHSFLSRF